MADVNNGGGVSARWAATDEFMEERIMAWMSKSEAAIALGLSPLVLSRKIAVGKFSAKSVGGRVLVDVPDRSDIGAEPNESLEDHVDKVNAKTIPADIMIPVTLRNEDETGTDESRSVLPSKGADAFAGENDQNPVAPEAVSDPLHAIDDSGDGGSLAAALDAVDRTRVLCDQEVAFAREDADRAWRSVERTERRLRQVVWVAASVLLIAVIVMGWQDRSQARLSRSSTARVAELEAVLAAAESREGGEIDGLRATVSVLRDEAALARDEAAFARGDEAEARDDLQVRLTDVGAELAATRVELDHVCWERDEAMRLRDRLKNEVAGQREHIEKMQSMQANLAARTLQRMIDESWDVTPVAPSVHQETAEFGDKPVTTQQASRQ